MDGVQNTVKIIIDLRGPVSQLSHSCEICLVMKLLNLFLVKYASVDLSMHQKRWAKVWPQLSWWKVTMWSIRNTLKRTLFYRIICILSIVSYGLWQLSNGLHSQYSKNDGAQYPGWKFTIVSLKKLPCLNSRDTSAVCQKSPRRNPPLTESQMLNGH